jgi:hypothetical protein
MEKTREENEELYISTSQKNIDHFINKNDFRKAYFCIADTCS